MPKVLTIAGASILALGLILGIALPTLAAPEWAKPWADDFQIRIVKGEVLEVGVDEENQKYFTIQSGEQQPTILVNDDTKYFKLCVPGRIVSLARHWMQFRHQNQEEIGVPGGCGMGLGLQNRGRVRALAQNQARLQNQIPPLDNGDLPKPAGLKWLRPFGEEAAFSDIAVGDKVVVWLANGDNLANEDDKLAERVLIIKPTTYASVSGTITDISSSAITITPGDGDPVPLSYNESTVFILWGIVQMEEQYAHAIYDSANMIAKRVTVSSTGG